MCTSAPTVASVLDILTQYTDLFGLPKHNRSDQGAVFTAHELKSWCRRHNVRQSFSPVADHRGTGLVERLIRTLRERAGACRLAAPGTSFRTTLHRVLQDIRLSVNANTNTSPSSLFLQRSPNTVFSNLSHTLYPVLEPTRIIEKGQWRTLREAIPSHLTTRTSESDTSGGAETRPRALARKTVRRRRPLPTPSPDTLSFASSDELPLRSRPPVVDLTRPGTPQRRTRRQRVHSTLAQPGPRTPSGSVPATPTIWYKQNPDGKAGTLNFRPLPGRIVSESTHTVPLDSGKVLRKNQLRVLNRPTGPIS